MIRRARLSDLGKIEELIKIGSQNGKVLLRSHEELGEAVKNFFVDVEQRDVVGCAALDIYSRKLAEIRSLVVLPEYQNQGVGGKLISKCLEKARELGIHQVLAVTDRHKLFKMAGFKAKFDRKTPMFVNLN